MKQMYLIFILISEVSLIEVKGCISGVAADFLPFNFIVYVDRTFLVLCSYVDPYYCRLKIIGTHVALSSGNDILLKNEHACMEVDQTYTYSFQYKFMTATFLVNI